MTTPLGLIVDFSFNALEPSFGLEGMSVNLKQSLGMSSVVVDDGGTPRSEVGRLLFSCEYSIVLLVRFSKVRRIDVSYSRSTVVDASAIEPNQKAGMLRNAIYIDHV
jgi:hypothetical protein